jgi:hypothetical protein
MVDLLLGTFARRGELTFIQGVRLENLTYVIAVA